MITALVNKIIPSSVVDGKGNRTVIFLQGCNIKCGYCHNPETQNQCRHCGECVGVCPTGALLATDAPGTSSASQRNVIWNAGLCIGCDQCVAVCRYNATPKVREMTAQTVFEEVKTAMPFIRGITVSGGECTLYPEFLMELFRLAKQHDLTCLLDSNGTLDFQEQEELLELCDGVMLDVKAWNGQVYQKLTGGNNKIVKKNLKFLAENKKLEEIRIVCLDEAVDAKEIIAQSAALVLPSDPDVTLKLIKFRNIGVKGAFSELESPSDDQMKELKSYAQEFGFYKIITI